jgi:uncharacterized membrane protein
MPARELPGRELSDRQRKWLEEQLADWTGREIVTGDQAARILAMYESAEEVGHRKRSYFSFVIIGLAALMVGLALFLLIGHNWDAIPRATKLLLIFGTILGTHAGGLYLRFSRDAPRASEIVAFLGCLFYGAGIWLVAQVFHLDAHYPDGVWWWAVGVLPFVLCLDTLLLHCLFVALLGLWAGMEVIGFTNLPMRLFWGWWMIPNGAYSLPLLALPGLAWAYRKKSAKAVGLYVPLLTWWVILQAIAWNLEWQTVYIVGCTGALLLMVAEIHPLGSRLAIPYRLYGVALAAGTLIPLSFGEFNKEVLRYRSWRFDDPDFGGLLQLAPLVTLVAATLAIGAYFIRPGGMVASPAKRLRELARRQWLPLGLSLALAGMSLWTMMNVGGDADSWVVPTIMANVGMIGMAFWLMRVGLRDDRGRPFTFGVLYFLLWSILRYIDLFAAAGGMLGAALMFFLCGATLFGVGMFWRGRKEARHV